MQTSAGNEESLSGGRTPKRARKSKKTEEYGPERRQPDDTTVRAGEDSSVDMEEVRL